MVEASAPRKAPTTVAAWIAFGSNVGDRLSHLRFALTSLKQAAGIDLDVASDVASVYETTPVDCAIPQGDFLNTVCRVKTSLAAAELLSTLHAVESERERRRPATNAPRTLDLDLLALGTLVRHEPALMIPHPRMSCRLFVLEPLCELEPAWMHPVTGTPIHQLLDSARAAHADQGISVFADRSWPVAV